MASSDVLSQTLHSITNIKLSQLSRQKSAYESAKTTLLQDATSTPSSASRARAIAKGGPALPTMNPFGSTSLPSITRLLDQAAHDPSVSPSAIESAERALRDELDVHSEKYRFAELYGRLVNDWIASGQDSDTSSQASGGFIPLGRAEMHAQRATWERYVFEPLQVDTDGITTYLTTLFLGPDVPKDATDAFHTVTSRLADFQDDWDKRTHFTEESLKDCIRGLLRSDLLSDQKRATLGEFLGNAAVLREMADVLNMRMQTRATWEWDPEAPAAIEQRRSLNGRYRFYPDEDLLQAVLLYYIGRSWGVEMRERLFAFMSSKGVMLPATREPDRETARRRRFFVDENPLAGKAVPGGTAPDWSVEGMLETHYRQEILLDQLPKTMDERRGKYEGDDEDGDTRKSPVQVVQELLGILQSMVTLRRGLGSETAVVRSDFTWFGPSLPHASIYAVLSFLGVRPTWVDFFRRALECPLQFGDDMPGTPARIRKRGLPLSTPIADFFAESLLFCLDYAVNRQADGARLYRLHDDMWLFGTTETCAQAWAVVTEFSALFGLGINEDKTGSVVVRPEGEAVRNEAAPGLPSGAVTWGFLRMDAASGRFLVDQAKVDTHIAELRLQLAACRSVFDWIQAWNIYGVRFFQTNLGGFARCHGRAHVDQVLATFRRIQDALFPGGEGVAGQVRAMLADRFDGADARAIPDGCLFYPTALGGLGLLNPFVAALSQIPGLDEDADKPFKKMQEADAREYADAKEKYEAIEPGTGKARRDGEFYDLRGSDFMGFEEFVKHRERTSRGFGRALKLLRVSPVVHRVEKPVGVAGLDAALRTLAARKKEAEAREGQRQAQRRPAWGTPRGWDAVPVYDQWVIAQHAQEMTVRFGGVTIVERGLLPMGLIDMLRQSRFKWQT